MRYFSGRWNCRRSSAGATNTPLACTMMSVELFGGEYVLHFAVACLMAYYSSGHSGIYLSQRLGLSKHGGPLSATDAALRSTRESKPSLRQWFDHRGP